MKLEQQVCSLELAKKLKELGVKQDSLFYWCGSHSNPDAPWEIHNWKVYNSEFRFRYYQSDDPVSAFTVAELGEMLPYRGSIYSEPVSEDNESKEWICIYGKTITKADTEADARAKMLIYLVENNLITL